MITVTADRNYLYNDGVKTNPRYDSINNITGFDPMIDAYDFTNFIYKHQVEARDHAGDFGYLMAHVQTEVIYHIARMLEQHVLRSIMRHEEDKKWQSKFDSEDDAEDEGEIDWENSAKWNTCTLKAFYTDIRNARLWAQVFQSKMTKYLGGFDETDSVIPITTWIFSLILFNRYFYDKGSVFEKYYHIE